MPPSIVIDKPLNRPFFTFQTQIVGPVFNRIWDTPNNGYAEKFKHTDRAVLDHSEDHVGRQLHIAS